jgi:HTH-type transcriptional regulator/antitoxin HigA
MKIQPIRTEADYDKALASIEKIWGAEPGTPNGDRLDVLLILVEDYESKHHPIDPPDPVEAIKFRMEQMNLSRKDLEPMIGPRGRVTEVINRRRPLSLAMIRNLHAKLHIPLESLIRESAPTGSNKAFNPTSLPPRLRRSGRAAG